MRRNKRNDLAKLADAFFEHLQEGDGDAMALGLDGKRPFGNQSVDADILEIIGWEPEGEEDSYTGAQESYAWTLMGELKGYLQGEWKKFRRRPSAD